MERQNNEDNSIFLERLEELALERRNCEITFLHEGGKVVIHGTIEIMYEQDGFRFLRMQTGLEIRLDKIIKVNGVSAELFC